MNKVILASKSPRRLEIMRKHGIEPIVMPSNSEEFLPDGIGMEEAVQMLALQKARAVYDAVASDNALLEQYSDAVIVGSDTIVYKDEILGKPADYDDAVRMLTKIRGTSHYVATGVALIWVDSGREEVLCDVTEVFCKYYSDEDIRNYIEQEQPYDKAGSYAIQGPFGQYIDHIEGDYENVVGLPFYRIESLICSDPDWI